MDAGEAVAAERLRMLDWTPFTTIDFPGRLACVVWIQGCPWRCPYCQNADMQPRDLPAGFVSPGFGGLTRFLERRRGLLEGVVFSGGEPCVDPALPDALRRVREMGFATGLHTSGAYPRRLAQCLPHLDWVGLDIKAPLDDAALYARLAGAQGAAEAARASLEALLASGVPFECRTTAHPDFLPEDRLVAMAADLKRRGVERWAVQICRNPPGTLFPKYPAVPDSWPGEAALAAIRRSVASTAVRR